MGARRTGRILAFQALYAWEATGCPAEGVVGFPWYGSERRHERKTGQALEFARLIAVGTIENITAVDEAIKRHLQRWDITRLARVDLAILRISAYCLMFQPEIPSGVTIDEAIEIARKFGSDESYRFINGVLDSIRKTAGRAEGQ